MENRKNPTDRENLVEFDRGFEGHNRRQARLGLTLSPAERLRWLEQTMEELRALLGRTRQGRPMTDDTG